MTQHLYAFGSLCRGEFDRFSDVDLLACVDSKTAARKIDSRQFSVYTYDRLQALWHEGNPFAWHLHLESKLVYSSDGSDVLAEFGEPSSYRNARADCAKFRCLFSESYGSLQSDAQSKTFHLSCMFLAVRNFATCYSFTKGRPNFSRLSPLQVVPAVPIEEGAFSLLVRARVLSTRGVGAALSKEEIALATKSCIRVHEWMSALESQEVLS
jgi:hypothetical protein